jgi:hypothetical protein
MKNRPFFIHCGLVVGTLPPANRAAALAAMRKSRKGLALPGVDN